MVIAGVVSAEHCIAIVGSTGDVVLLIEGEVSAVVLDEALGSVGSILPGYA